MRTRLVRYDEKRALHVPERKDVMASVAKVQADCSHGGIPDFFRVTKRSKDAKFDWALRYPFALPTLLN